MTIMHEPRAAWASDAAGRCYTAGVLARLTAEELAALDAYAARALDDPDAAPVGAAERAAVKHVDALVEARRVRPTLRAGRS